MNYKSFVMKIMAMVLVCVASVGSFIFYMDPMWTFGHHHQNNDVQTVINERQQKTNRILFQPFPYDTLLLGSSRTTYINQNDFKNMNVYNFAVSNASIQEYNSLIELAKKKRGKEFDRIIIGLDFFKSNIKESSAKKSMNQYITAASEPFYRYKNLLSMDLLEYSWQNFKMSKENKVLEERNYNRSNVANAKAVDPELMEKQTEAKIQKFREVFYGDTYEYNPEYKEVLSQLKKNNPNTEFIVFTTPISSPLFEAMVEEGRLPDYETWLKDVTEVFGGVYNFMYPNSVTEDLENYFDGHHFYPEVGKLIAQRISQGNSSTLPSDFGTYVSGTELAAHLKGIRKESEPLLVNR
ncbi:hypothetical protein GCM10009865_10940 [Aeromicrobium ponti]|uniref:Uncharacterized protein n=1 Tax=Cytobacillus oceanisediminis TaxID=665099 RepID=A0A562K2R6_9BACI|nr:hypothetical protein [Cytobacillus oceanisediminis]TWH89722.1 hypothetical protein IQ19_00969 [Cytobacillus oceanisediminis]